MLIIIIIFFQILSGISVFLFPFCSSYTSYVVVASMLGLFVSAYISLTSIVLVDLIGLDSLTSRFVGLVFFPQLQLKSRCHNGTAHLLTN